MAAKKETAAAAPAVSDKKKALETAMQQIEKMYGKGSIVGTVLGMLIIGVMNNLLTLFGVPPFLREACKGVIVIVAVLLQKKEADA